ncbi:MAG TPA: pitrilysin family protein [Sphingobacteriaceae bacterium]|nr:pitrilysin family protein [Sphingobacteriaceae bacterium]
MGKTIKNIVIAVFAVLAGNALYAQSNSNTFKVPAYEKFTLSNGLTIYLMEQHEVPTISLSVIIPAGAIYDGPKAGLASLTASALQFGTKSYTKNLIEDELDFAGANLETYASKESAGLSAKFASKDQDKILPIIKEILINPTFNAEEFAKEKKRVLVGLEQAKESPRSVINSYYDKLIFGDHVYGNPVSGSPLTINKFTVEDLKSFYSANYSATGSAIAIVGDFDTKEMKAKASKLFAEWRKGTRQQNLASQPVAVPASARVLLVNKEDARETTFLIGGLGISRNNPDYVAIDVVNTVFGGRFTSMLNDELRVNSGLTYGANSRFSTLKNSGTFAISTFTANKTTGPAINKALEVLNTLHSKGINEENLTSAKNYVKGLLPPKFETSGQLAGLLTSMFWYDYDESYINNFEKNVNELTAMKVKQIINTYFTKDKLQFVLIGKAAEIKEIAGKLGTVIEKQIKADGF